MADSAGRILVVGSSGAVGGQVCAEVLRQCGVDSLVLGDYRLERARATAERMGRGVEVRLVDVNQAATATDVIDDSFDAVIVCTQQREPVVQQACLAKGVPCLDVTVARGLIRSIRALDDRARKAGVVLLYMAGLFPGLSGMMAERAAAMLDEVYALDLALCQSTQSTVGAAGIADMLGSYAEPATLRCGGGQRVVPGFSEKRVVHYPQPFGDRSHRLVGFAEAEVLRDELGIADVNLWTGFDSRAFDRLVGVLNRVGLLALFRRERTRLALGSAINGVKRLGPKRPEPIAVVAEASGVKGGRQCRATVTLTAPSDYGTTAMAVVAMARTLTTASAQAAGACHPLRLFDLHALLVAFGCDEVIVDECLHEPTLTVARAKARVGNGGG